MTPRAAIGLLCLSLMLSGCSSAPVVLSCPPIPKAILEPCQPPAREIATNGDLALAYVETLACLREDRIKLAAIKALADCRASAP